MIWDYLLWYRCLDCWFLALRRMKKKFQSRYVQILSGYNLNGNHLIVISLYNLKWAIYQSNETMLHILRLWSMKHVANKISKEEKELKHSPNAIRLKKVVGFWPHKLEELFEWHNLHEDVEATAQNEMWRAIHGQCAIGSPQCTQWGIFQPHGCWTFVLKGARSSLQTEQSSLRWQMGFLTPR